MATESGSIVEVRMPDLGADMTKADLVAWLVAVGDHVAAGDLIAEIETDKSTVEFESPVAGRVLELCVEAPKMGIEIGELIARIDSTESVAQAAPTEREARPVQAATPLHDSATTIAATALARRIADQRGVDLQAVRPSGAGGRITKADVEHASDAGAPAAAKAAPPSAEAAAVAPVESLGTPAKAPRAQGSLSRMRRTIATRLSEAKRDVPHFYLEASCAADALVEIRSKLNSNSATKLSINDFCVAAAARALRDVPAANVAWRGDSIEQFESIDIAVAVAIPEGLITPVVRGADRFGLIDLAARLRLLVERARSGALEPREYSGGFNISNLGMYGITAVWPIVNPPHACILGLGAIEQVPVVRDGAVVPGSRMTATLSADHRAVDGAIGAQLLAAFRGYIERPLEMML